MSAPMTLHERLAVAKFFAEYFAGYRESVLDPEARAEMTIGERTPVKFGGQFAAWVSLPNTARTATVKDKAAFLAWVKQHMPDEVETAEVVRPATQRALLADAKARGGCWLDRTSGELVPIDGVEAGDGKLTPRVELDDLAAVVIGQAWRAGLIDISPMLALPASPDGGEPGE